MDDPTSESTVHVALGERSYDIAIVSNRLEALPQFIDERMTRRGAKAGAARSALVVTDRNVAGRHGVGICRGLAAAGWHCVPAVLEPGEQTKCLQSASEIYDRLVEMQADRQTAVIAVGGGVIGDLAGFVAATYARGIPFVQVPTTLLAQVDSSVGGKVGINHPRGKNLIGAFYQPLGVYIDTSLLDTMPPREFRSGLAEVIKYGVILDAPFFEYLESHVEDIFHRTPASMRHVVATSCRLKADVVERDEFERTGVRAVLNYGHTFGHAFEALSGYGVLLHGEAIAIGMICASRLAERLKLIDAAVTERQRTLLHAVGLPTVFVDPAPFDVEAVLSSMRLDKKTVSGKLRFVLPTKIGHVETVNDVPESDVRAVIEGCLAPHA